MGRFSTPRLASVILILLGTALPGCASWPWGGKVSDTVLGITPPNEQIADMRKLAAGPVPNDPAERERIASQLAAAYAREPDPLIRAATVAALGTYSGPTAIGALGQAAKDPDSGVRIAVCKALARHARPEATTLLRQVFASDVDVDVRLAAARALGETRDPAAIATLGAALDERDPAMQYRVVGSLRKVAPHDLGNSVDQWREYVQSQSAPPASAPGSQPMLAEPIRQSF
jgi:HEAT repeat protein